MDDDEKYLIERIEYGLERGLYRVFWKPNSLGYTIDIDSAGRYPKAKANEITTRANVVEDCEVAWPESEVLSGKAGRIARVIVAP